MVVCLGTSNCTDCSWYCSSNALQVPLYVIIKKLGIPSFFLELKWNNL